MCVPASDHEAAGAALDAARMLMLNELAQNLSSLELPRRVLPKSSLCPLVRL